MNMNRHSYRILQYKLSKSSKAYMSGGGPCPETKRTMDCQSKKRLFES